MTLDACGGHLWLVLLLLALFTPTPRRALHRGPRTRRLPWCNRMDRMARCGPCHVRADGRAYKPTVHRVRLSPLRAGSCVDFAWILARSGLFFKSGSGSFREQAGYDRGWIADAGDRGAGACTPSFCARFPARKAYVIKNQYMDST